jgi:hypothetical protein
MHLRVNQQRSKLIYQQNSLVGKKQTSEKALDSDLIDLLIMESIINKKTVTEQS